MLKTKHSDFNSEKAIEVIIYLAENISEPTFHSIGKLLYFSDKTSLERYGRLICGESYFALKEGPVPTNIYDIMKESIGNGTNGFVIENGHHVKPLRKADLDMMSDSDIQCLNQTIERYGNAPYWERREKSHDEAYHQAWNSRGNKKSVPMSIESIAGLLEDSDSLIEHLRSEDID